MARFEPGKSGNPKGRPPKERALTLILERAGSKTIERGGRKVARKQVLAEILWQTATTGKLELEDSGLAVERIIDTDEWLTVVQFLYRHIDGPPKSEFDVTTKGEKLPNAVQIYLPDNGRGD